MCDARRRAMLPQWSTSLSRCLPQWVNHIARSSTWIPQWASSLSRCYPFPTVVDIAVAMPPVPHSGRPRYRDASHNGIITTPGRRPGSHSGRHRCRDASRSPQWASSLSRCHPLPTGCLVYIKAGLLVLCRSALMSCCLVVTCGGHCWLSSSAAA